MKTDNYLTEVFAHSPDDVLKAMMKININNAKSIYNLCKEQECLDSQEFLDWQDELNAISIKYE